MNKILLVIQREYLSRVKKKSFIVITILGPLLIMALYGGIIYFAINKDAASVQSKVLLVDEDGHFSGKLKDTKALHFIAHQGSLQQAMEILDKDSAESVLYIPHLATDKASGIEYISEQAPGMMVKDYIEKSISEILETEKMQQLGISQETLDKVKTRVDITTRKPNNELNSTEIGTLAASVASILIYMFIFMYGAMVMRGVMEEKTNRIVEVVLSSLKPFQLMTGKVIGIALVGLTQFLIWIALSGILVTAISAKFGVDLSSGQEGLKQLQTANPEAASKMSALFNQLYAVPWLTIAGMFVFYFVTGYLFYGALFAAIGSSVDSETDSSQFMFPITIPLIFALAISNSVVIQDPHSPTAVWLSMIPFTSPIVMMARLPFEVPGWQLLLSVACMILGFLFTTWLAGRIYRIGILMYGKKPTYKELGRWLFYKG